MPGEHSGTRRNERPDYNPPTPSTNQQAYQNYTNRYSNIPRKAFSAKDVTRGAGDFLVGWSDWGRGASEISKGNFKSGLGSLGTAAAQTALTAAELITLGAATGPVLAAKAGLTAGRVGAKVAVRGTVGKTAVKEGTNIANKAADDLMGSTGSKYQEFDNPTVPGGKQVIDVTTGKVVTGRGPDVIDLRDKPGGRAGQGSGSGGGQGRGRGSGRGDGQGAGQGTGTGGGTATKTDVKPDTRTGGRAGEPEQDRISRPRVEQNNRPQGGTRPGGTAVMEPETDVRLGSSIIERTQPTAPKLTPRVGGALGLGSSLQFMQGLSSDAGLTPDLQTETKLTSTTKVKTAVGVAAGAGGGGGGTSSTPSTQGEQANIKRVY